MSTTPGPVEPEAVLEEPVVVTTGAGVLQGWVWKFAASTLPQLYALGVSIVAARVLGPDLLGRRSFISFIELSAISFLAGGVPPALMRFVAETTGSELHSATRRLISVAWRLEIGVALLGFFILAAVAAAGADPRAAWLLAAFICGTGILTTVPAAVLRGLQRWREAAIVTIVTGGAAMLGIVIVLLLGGGITGMFAVEAVAAIVGLVWTRKYADAAMPRVRPPWGTLPESTRKGFVAFAAGSSVVVVIELIVLKRSELFFLEAYSSDAEIAFYSIAFAIVSGLVRLPGTAASVLVPAVAHLFGAGQPDRIRSGFARAFRLINLLSVTLVAFSMALGPGAVSLIWGEEFARAGDVLLIMAFASVFVPIGTVSSALLSGVGRIRVPVVIGIVAAAIDIALAFALVPPLDAIGAAVANGAAQAVLGLLSLVYALHVIGPVRLRWNAIIRGAIIAAAGGLAAWVVELAIGGALGLVAGFIAGGLVFLAAASAIGALAREDADWLISAVHGRAGRVVGWLAPRVAGPPTTPT